MPVSVATWVAGAVTRFGVPLVTEPPSKDSGKSPMVRVPPPVLTTTLVTVMLVGMNVLVMVHVSDSPIAVMISPLLSQSPLNTAE